MPRPQPEPRTEGGYERFDVKELELDPENPRLIELDVRRKPSQFDLLKALWDKMAVGEVAMSIAYNGYFEHEPILIEKSEAGRLVVIEGNRRLTAVRVLLDAELRTRLNITDLPDIDAVDPSRRKEISTIPGILTTRKEQWRYLGWVCLFENDARYGVPSTLRRFL